MHWQHTANCRWGGRGGEESIQVKGEVQDGMQYSGTGKHVVETGKKKRGQHINDPRHGVQQLVAHPPPSCGSLDPSPLFDPSHLTVA